MIKKQRSRTPHPGILSESAVIPLVTMLCAAVVILLFPLQSFPAAHTATSDNATTDTVQPAQTDFVIIVNGHTLTRADLEAQITNQLESLAGQIPPAQMEAFNEQMETMETPLRDNIIERFTLKTLLKQEFEKKHIILSDEELNRETARIKAKLPADMQLETYLQNEGLTYEDIAFSLKVDKLITAVAGVSLEPSPKEIARYYEKNRDKLETVHVRHILIKTLATDNETVRAAKKARIESLRKKLLAGADFASVAKATSQCPSSARGGDLGTFGRGKMVKPFEDAAFSQEVNEIGPVFTTPFGYHIVQVLSHNTSLDTVRGRVRKVLEQKKMQDFTDSYIASLKKNADIVHGSP